jgi:hypothetical protein
MTMQMVKDSPYVFVSELLRVCNWFMFLLASGSRRELPRETDKS